MGVGWSMVGKGGKSSEVKGPEGWNVGGKEVDPG
jgi:hypothetical protein